MQKPVTEKGAPRPPTKPWRPSRAVIAAIGAVIVAIAGFIFYGQRPLTVPVVALERNVPIKVYGLGTVEARVLSDVGFEVGAALTELHVDHGDRVAKGAILARLHSTEQAAKVAKAQAGVVNAEAALQSAQALVGRAEAILAHKEDISQRRQALLGKQITSVEQASDAEKEAVVARADVATAKSNVAVAHAHLEDAKAQLEYERVLLDHHVLTAPYDALVVKRHKELGAVLKAGESLFTLIDPTSIWALAYIDEGRAGDLRVDQPAEVRLRSRPRETFEARVARIGIESDRVSEERRVYVKCQQCPDIVHLGEQVEVLITTDQLTEALLVPERAIQGFDGARGTVWLIDDGALRQRQVMFGPRTNDGRVVVTSKLPEGARLVRELPRGAADGHAARAASEAVR